MAGFVYQQWYNSKNKDSTKVLNQKHFEYILVRKGVMRNIGCSWGGWGKMPGAFAPENLENPNKAKKEIGQISKDHTIYRAFLSADKKMAQEFDLYKRANWEVLINKRIGVIAKEMDIAPENFCWVASVHYKKTHPHVHIMFWDNGNDPRSEYIPPKQFERKMENIRAAFNRELYGEKIRELQVAQNTVEKLMRIQLQCMVQENFPAEALDLDRISKARINEMATSMEWLIMHAPTYGSLKYQVLPTAYKIEMDKFIGQMMKVPALGAMYNKFSLLTEEISTLYGNGKPRAQENLERALKRLRKGLANEILDSIRDALNEMPEVPLAENAQELKEWLQETVSELIRENKHYAKLLALTPKWRTPLDDLRKDLKIEAEVHALTNDLWTDIRVRKIIESFIKANRPVAYFQKERELIDKLKEKNLEEEKRDMLKAELKLLRKEEIVGKEANRLLNTIVYYLINQQFQQDKGYNWQQAQDTVVMALLRCFAYSSQAKNQAKARQDLLQAKHRELSQAAKRDLKTQNEQAGSWQAEM